MKYLKRFLEKSGKQLDMFSGTEDDQRGLPNNPNDVALKYIKGFKGKKQKYSKFDTFKSFDDASIGLDDKDVVKELLLPSFNFDDMSEYSNIFIYQYRLENILRIFIGNNKKDIIGNGDFLLFIDDDFDSDDFDSDNFDETYDIDELIEFMIDYFEDNRCEYNTLEGLVGCIDDNFGVYVDLFSDLYIEEMLSMFMDTDEFTELGDWIWYNKKKDGDTSCDIEDGILYRYMDISDNFDGVDIDIKEFDGVGEYWTREISSAQNYNGSSSGMHNGITLISLVSVNNVKWVSTLFKTFYDLKEEKEVELIKGTSIEIIGFELRNNSPHIEQLKDNDYTYMDNLGISESDIESVIRNKYGYGIRFKESITVVV